jgi:hypothetical protein
VIYVRSILAGLVAVLAAAVILSFLALLVPTIRYGPMADAWNVFSPFSARVRWPLAWFLATIIFGAGFYWEWQNLSSQDRGNFSRLQFKVQKMSGPCALQFMRELRPRDAPVEVCDVIS